MMMNAHLCSVLILDDLDPAEQALLYRSRRFEVLVSGAFAGAQLAFQLHMLDLLALRTLLQCLETSEGGYSSAQWEVL